MKGRRLLRVLFVLCVIALSTLPILSHIPTARAVFSNNPIVRSGWTIPWNVSLDFAIGSDVRNIILQYQTVGWVPIRQETVLNDTGMRDSSHMFTSWEVAQGSRGVFFTPTDIHETLWTPGTIIVVQDHANEIEKSHLPDQVDQDLSSYVNGESVFRKDIAVWYMSRHYDNPFLQTNLAAPVLTGLVFYASGY